MKTAVRKINMSNEPRFCNSNSMNEKIIDAKFT